jgi:hypothetical protein
MHTLIAYFLFFTVVFMLTAMPYSTTWLILVAGFVGFLLVLAVIT